MEVVPLEKADALRPDTGKSGEKGPMAKAKGVVGAVHTGKTMGGVGVGVMGGVLDWDGVNEGVTVEVEEVVEEVEEVGEVVGVVEEEGEVVGVVEEVGEVVEVGDSVLLELDVGVEDSELVGVSVGVNVVEVEGVID